VFGLGELWFIVLFKYIKMLASLGTFACAAAWREATIEAPINQGQQRQTARRARARNNSAAATKASPATV